MYYIVLEGIDGCGTTAQVNNVAEGIPSFEKTAEPTKYEIGQLIRSQIAVDTMNNKLYEGMKDNLLFMADRIYHHQHFIIPTLENGHHVVSDRNECSTIAYQGAAGVDIDDILYLRKSFHDKGAMIKPHKVYIIDVPVEVGLSRVNKRSGEKEKFEKAEYLEKVRNIYLDMPNILPDDNIEIIDGMPPEEVVCQDLINRMGKEFNF